MEKFYNWSGLKINLGKRYVTIFGRDSKEPKFVEELKLKWCNNFKLLGIHFDATLSEMQKNYQIGLDSIKKELHSWKFRHLKIFRKLTVIKTLSAQIDSYRHCCSKSLFNFYHRTGI